MKTIEKTKLALTVIGLALGLTFSSCKKGDTGPAGAAGTNGTNGNANVVSSSITTSAWTFVSPAWEMSFTYPAITQAILDKGAVLVYVKDGNNYYQLPFTYYPAATYSQSFEVESYLGGLKVYVTDSDLTQPQNPGSLTYKVVVIAASARMANPNVNYDNYEDVKNTFNLKD